MVRQDDSIRVRCQRGSARSRKEVMDHEREGANPTQNSLLCTCCAACKRRLARSFRFTCGAVLILALASPVLAALALPRTPIRSYMLPNGLRVVMAHDDQAPVVDVQVWYHVGSRDERPGMLGLAHLFEHLMFDGTRNLAPSEFSNYVVRWGGVDNAYTTTDATVFWETVPSVDLPVVLWLEADRMQNLAITSSTFKNERRVVEEEARQRFGNQPYGSLLETLYAHAFTVSPYQHRPIGISADLERATLDDVRAFYHSYYVPNNATLVIVGKFSESAAAAQIAKYFGPLAATAGPIPRDYRHDPPQAAERVVSLKRAVSLPVFVEGFHVPADGAPDAYPLELATKILADGESSWMYRRLVYQKQIAMQVDCEANFSELPNLLYIFAVMNPGRDMKAGEAEVAHLLERLREGDISEDDMRRAKNEVLRDFILNRQTARSRADALGYDAVVLRDANLYNTEIDRFSGLTAADVARVASKYLVSENMTLVEVSPTSN